MVDSIYIGNYIGTSVAGTCIFAGVIERCIIRCRNSSIYSSASVSNIYWLHIAMPRVCTIYIGKTMFLHGWFTFNIYFGNNMLRVASAQYISTLQYTYGRREHYILNNLLPEQLHVQYIFTCITSRSRHEEHILWLLQ